METPRRNNLDLNSPAEIAIRKAIDAVEQLGADTQLTEIVVLLGRALDKTADFIDTKGD